MVNSKRIALSVKTMDINGILTEKRGEILRIAERYSARNVRVFGSVARGDDDADSDVDLLVTFDKGVGLLQCAAMTRALEQLLGRKVDVLADDGIRPRIRDRVLREAVAL